MKHPRHKAIRLWRKRHPIKIKITITDEELRYAFKDTQNLNNFISYLLDRTGNELERRFANEV